MAAKRIAIAEIHAYRTYDSIDSEHREDIRRNLRWKRVLLDRGPLRKERVVPMCAEGFQYAPALGHTSPCSLHVPRFQELPMCTPALHRHKPGCCLDGRMHATDGFATEFSFRPDPHDPVHHRDL